MAEGQRTHAGNSGPATRRSPHLDFRVAPNAFENSQKRQVASGSRWYFYQIRHSEESFDRPRDLRSQAAAQRGGRWKLMKFMVRYEKSARLTITFHETQSVSKLRGRDAWAALGGGGAPVRPSLRRGLFAAFFAGQGEMGRAAKGVCREPVLRLVGQCISRGKVWAVCSRPPCGTWSKASSTTPRTSTDPLEDWVTFDSRSP